MQLTNERLFEEMDIELVKKNEIWEALVQDEIVHE